MWVTFQHQKTKQIKKFNIPSTNMELVWTNKDGTWDRMDRIEEPKRVLAGFAILRTDPKTNLPMWATFNGEGKGFKEYPPAHPLLFPAEAGKLPVGARVELHLPEEV